MRTEVFLAQPAGVSGGTLFRLSLQDAGFHVGDFQHLLVGDLMELLILDQTVPDTA